MRRRAVGVLVLAATTLAGLFWLPLLLPCWAWDIWWYGLRGE